MSASCLNVEKFKFKFRCKLTDQIQYLSSETMAQIHVKFALPLLVADIVSCG